MRHHILVKWNSTVKDKSALSAAVRALYDRATQVEGISGVRISDNVINRPNRYDLLIVLTMEEAALPAWDACELHKQWKRDFGDKIESKAIFDCD